MTLLEFIKEIPFITIFLVVSTNLIAYLVEKEPPTIADIANSIITFIFFSVLLAFECVFYKREKVNKIAEENSEE